MTSIRVSLVDLYVLRGAGLALECLVLRRAPGGRCPGSWEAVHGHIESGETPAEAARRELDEETGLRADRLYNLSRVETFYQHGLDEVALVPVFAAWVPPDATVRTGVEHDRFEWL
ncbi:MAG: NUDIX domain-containing protein, partial [Gemmatimonadales bacterium]